MKTDVSLQRFLHLWFFPSKKSITIKKFSEQGLTLLETLVGILIITFVLAASTPPILLATATRIQNRRAEQAMQLAQREVDKVRLIVERETSLNNELPLAKADVSDPDNIKDVPAPNTVCTSSCDYPSFTQLRDEGDFLVQVFREPGVKETDIQSPDPTPNNEDRVMAFRMGVRVYSKAARENITSLLKDPSSLQITNGLGQQLRRPLAVLYVDFARSDLTLSLRAYRSFTD